MLRYKFDVLEMLKSKGYTTFQIRKNRLFSEGTLTKFRNGIVVGASELDKLCKLLECQPGDILEYTADNTPDDTQTV